MQAANQCSWSGIPKGTSSWRPQEAKGALDGPEAVTDGLTKGGSLLILMFVFHREFCLNHAQGVFSGLQEAAEPVAFSH